MRKSPKEKPEIDIREMLALQEELKQTKKEYGIEEKEGRISRIISGFFDRRDSRQKQPLNRKKYLLLAIFTGWCGGHRFYAKRYVVAILYLLFFWTGFPLAMTIIDILTVIPMKADENGMICL